MSVSFLDVVLKDAPPSASARCSFQQREDEDGSVRGRLRKNELICSAGLRVWKSRADFKLKAFNQIEI